MERINFRDGIVRNVKNTLFPLHVSLLFLVGLRVVNIPFGRLIECCTYDVNSRRLEERRLRIIQFLKVLAMCF